MYSNDINSLKINIINHSIEELRIQISRLQNRMNAVEQSFYDLKHSMEKLNAGLRSEADVLTVPKNENTTQKICKENIDYVDLDNLKNEKGIWELYDENWWNK